jgi:hypothetical protein
MKRIILSFVAIFMAILTFGQNTPQANGELIQKNGDESSLTNSQQFPPLASIASLNKPDFNNEVYKYDGEHAMYNCQASRKMEIAGIVLSAVGGGFVISGSLIQASAYRANYDGTISNYQYYRRVNGGGAMIGLGAVGVAVGIPIAIIGSINVHRYCYGHRYRNESEEY